jgi:uncharacterized protein (TIGR03382 family)
MTTLAAFLLPLFLGGPSLGTPPGEHVSAAAMWTQEAEFTTPIEDDLDFGSLVALGPATIAAAGQVGAASMVYVYDRAAGAWAEPAQLSFPEDILIQAVGLSGDDMVTLVTYTAAYTSERLESGWSEPHTVLTLPDGDLFGRVHITDDVMVLGTYESSGPCTQQARIRVFRRAGQAWAADGEVAAADCADESPVHFGLAADGDRLVSIMAGQEAQGGVARVYRRSGEATWEIETTLEAPSIAADGGYTEVAIQGDTLVLGAQYANDERGRADVYVERGDGWHLQQSIHGVGEGNNLVANGGWFGGPLAIDGDLLAIGSPNESSPKENSEGLLQSGTVRIYGYAGEWVEEASLSLRGPDKVFGTDLALRGSRLVIGSSWFNEPSSNSVHVFTRQGDAPAGMCLDDSECSAGTCTDGICLPEDDDDDPKTGCGCSSNAGDVPVAALLAFMFLGRRRRSAHVKVQPISSRKIRPLGARADALVASRW